MINPKFEECFIIRTKVVGVNTTTDEIPVKSYSEAITKAVKFLQRGHTVIFSVALVSKFNDPSDPIVRALYL